MSAKTLFANLYFDLCQKAKVLRDEKGELIVRLQQCEDQRKSLLFLVRSCATNFEENHFPQVAALLRRSISDLETDYEALAVRPKGDTAPDPQPDTGPALSQTGLSVGTQEGMSESRKHNVYCTCAYHDRDGEIVAGTPCEVHPNGCEHGKFFHEACYECEQKLDSPCVSTEVPG